MTTTVAKNSTPAKSKPLAGGLGLEGMGDLSALLDGPADAKSSGRPLDLDLSLIEEDPQQPRTEGNPGFADESQIGRAHV